jgi:hypothetical protein
MKFEPITLDGRRFFTSCGDFWDFIKQMIGEYCKEHHDSVCYLTKYKAPIIQWGTTTTLDETGEPSKTMFAEFKTNWWKGWVKVKYYMDSHGAGQVIELGINAKGGKPVKVLLT